MFNVAINTFKNHIGSFITQVYLPITENNKYTHNSTTPNDRMPESCFYKLYMMIK